MNKLCIFCGAQPAVPQQHLDIGTTMGEAMAKADKALVYGGGDSGLMGAIANAVMDGGGWVTGVFPRSLRNLEREHGGLSEIHIVDTMHERKQMMYELSDTFLIFPGGFGTMDELFEILTWKQLKLHDKPIIIFNHEGYWDHLVALMENILANGFAKLAHREIYEVVHDFETLKARIGM